MLMNVLDVDFQTHMKFQIQKIKLNTFHIFTINKIKLGLLKENRLSYQNLLRCLSIELFSSCHKYLFRVYLFRMQ